MRVALVNPAWDYAGSIYFGCREPHLPLELGYTAALLRQRGHDVLLVDGHLAGIGNAQIARSVAGFAPDLTVVTTAPTYLFWRCPPPELRVPADLVRQLDRAGGRIVAVGPHGSTTPRAVLRKLAADIVVRGECEEIVARLADGDAPAGVPSIAYLSDGELVVTGGPHASRFVDHPPLEWPQEWLTGHRHHHHRFDAAPDGPGAEVEASRGCPFACSFCAKLDFRDAYRKRELPNLLAEIDRLIAQGVTYIYFVDEIFLPQEPLLRALAERDIAFGVQMRIDLWKPEQLELLGRAGCVSIEAGVESLSVEGRAALQKRCRMDNEQLADRLIEARRHVPFVQANLIGTEEDDPETIARWRERLERNGVWANDPVPLFPYPASPSYRQLWGEPDDDAWERAHEHYLNSVARFSDIQNEHPSDLRSLETSCFR